MPSGEFHEIGAFGSFKDRSRIQGLIYICFETSFLFFSQRDLFSILEASFEKYEFSPSFAHLFLSKKDSGLSEITRRN